MQSGARVYGHVDSTYWLDLGTPAAFARGSADLVAGLAPTAAMPKSAKHDSDQLVLLGSEVAQDAVLSGGTTVGAEVVIGTGAGVHASVIMDGCRIGAGARIERSVIGKSVSIGAGSVVVGAVLGDDVVIGAGCELLDGVRIWPGVQIPDGGLRFSAES